MWPEASVSGHRLITCKILFYCIKHHIRERQERYFLRNTAQEERLNAECDQQMQWLQWSTDSQQELPDMAASISQAIMSACHQVFLGQNRHLNIEIKGAPGWYRP